METPTYTLATLADGSRAILVERESTHRKTLGLRPMSRKAFFADEKLAAEFGGNYFDYMKSNESIGAMASEEARANGLVFAGCNRSTDKVTGELLSTSVRWARARKGKADDEIAKLRVELNAALVEIAAFRKARK